MVEVVVEVTMVFYRQVRTPPKIRDDAGSASSLREPLKADCHPQNIDSQPSTGDCHPLNCHPVEQLVHVDISRKPQREKKRTHTNRQRVSLIELDQFKQFGKIKLNSVQAKALRKN